MNSLIIFLILFFVWRVENTQNTIEVKIYYESQCPDSDNFLYHQFKDVYNKLGSAITPKLIPYGKAMHHWNNGKWGFYCQHGPEECFYNKLHACIVANNEISEQTKVGLVICLMHSQNDICECSRIIRGVNWEIVLNCANSAQGDKLLVCFGQETQKLNPKLTFVPTVLIKGKHGDQSKTLQHFGSEICSHFQHPKPNYCNGKKKIQ